MYAELSVSIGEPGIKKGGLELVCVLRISAGLSSTKMLTKISVNTELIARLAEDKP